MNRQEKLVERNALLEQTLWQVVKAVHRYGTRNAQLTTVVDRIAGQTLRPGEPMPNPKIPADKLWSFEEGKKPNDA